MKKATLAMCLVLPGLMYADVCTVTAGVQGAGSSFYGPTSCGSGSVDSASVNGPLALQGTSIKTVTVNGPLSANNANVGDAFVHGVIKAENSNFKSITINGDVNFNASTAENIVVKGSPTIGSYKVKLDQNSRVNNITFETGSGVVIEGVGAKVTGKITGAQVQTQANLK